MVILAVQKHVMEHWASVNLADHVTFLHESPDGCFGWKDGRMVSM
jgi:hypothetical protein